MILIKKNCIVCQNDVPIEELVLNQEVNLMVCNNCKGTPEEKQIVKELLESLADGFVCGCI
jgi:hypothetical protein